MNLTFEMAKNAGNPFVLVLIILVFPCFINLNLIKAAPQSSLVTSLPGFNGSFPSKHYSGYVPIDKKNAKQMFYYFVESERNPTKDPVVLWLNGGPGCSSLGGFVYEHGPFKFEASSPIKFGESIKKGSFPAKLHLNPNSWSKVSNIIYLDSPVGTGFSFSWNTTDYETGDLKTGSDTYIFLLKWFEMFPEHLHNPFYVAGESYAGISIPILASKILKGLNSGAKPIINLQGYMIGNGIINKYFDQMIVVRFAHGMGLISDDLYQGIVHACHGRNYFHGRPSSVSCRSKLDKFHQVIRNLNLYNIMEPCYDFDYDPEYECYNCIDGDLLNNVDDMKMSTPFDKHKKHIPVKTRIFAHARPLTHHITTPNSLTWSQVVSNITVLCNDEIAPTLWLNHEAVRKAIHAVEESKSGPWEVCTNRLTYHGDVKSVIKYHKRLISSHLRVLIYSGDHDMVVPYTGSEEWTRSLGYKIIDEWRPWLSNAQIAGFTQGYDKNLTFLTIKGAGHMVPEDKPREALDFYSRWLAGEKI